MLVGNFKGLINLLLRYLIIYFLSTSNSTIKGLYSSFNSTIIPSTSLIAKFYRLCLAIVLASSLKPILAKSIYYNRIGGTSIVIESS